MDIGIIIGIIGLVATLIFGFLSLDLIKRKKYPGKISCIKLSAVSLLNDVAKNFREIKLLHNNNPIEQNLVYIKGAFINNGDIDIKSVTTENSIIMSLPDDYKWVDLTISSHSENLACTTSTLSDNKKKIKFDLFKRDEFIVYEGLISAPEGFKVNSFEEIIKFSHRIENTSSIGLETILDKKTLRARKIKHNLFFSVIIFMAILASLAMYFNEGTRILYQQRDSDDKEVYFARIQEDDTIILKKYSNNLFIELFEEFIPNSQTLSNTEFLQNYTVAKYRSSNGKTMLLFLIGMYTLLFGLMAVPEYFQERKTKRILRILGELS